MKKPRDEYFIEIAKDHVQDWSFINADSTFCRQDLQAVFLKSDKQQASMTCVIAVRNMPDTFRYSINWATEEDHLDHNPSGNPDFDWQSDSAGRLVLKFGKEKDDD
jgi:hypothetical protein